jgi:drug/metabolite transporter (DMT)-like permease
LVGLGVLGTGIAYLFYFRLIRNIGPTRTSMVTYLLPCTALIYGVVLLREPATANIVAGLALVLVGIGLTLGMLRPPARLRPATARD